MNIKHIFLFLIFLFPAWAIAGEIYGTLKKDGKPLANQEIKITQNGKELGKATTDKDGYFSVTLKQVGQFKLEVAGYEGAIFDVVSTNSSTDYTLSLIKSGDVWQLKKL